MTDFQAIGEGKLPGHLGIEVGDVTSGRVTMRIALAEHHLAPNGYLHAATALFRCTQMVLYPR